MTEMKEYVENLLGLGYSEDDFELAMTSKSYGVPNNERMEFIGNAVLNMHLANVVFRIKTELSPEVMSKVCNYVRSDEYLTDVGNYHGLDKHIRVGPSIKDGELGREMVSTAFEALIGMLFDKAGFDIAAKFIDSFITIDESNIEECMNMDPITRLKEYGENKEGFIIVHDTIKTKDGKFEHIIIHDSYRTQGEGKNKKDAKKRASELMLKILEDD